MMKECITITFSENVENHVGNQQIGYQLEKGYDYSDLRDMQNKLRDDNYETKLLCLNKLLGEERELSDPAYILIIRNAVEKNDILFGKLRKLNWDKKAKMRGKVVNKHARYNLCFADFEQEPNYDIGNGRVYSFENIPELEKLRDYLQELTETKLNAEGNYYYDTNKCGIGYHGDAERKVVIGCRFGSNIPLHFRWYKNSIGQGKKLKINLDSGDMYIMSEKTTGFDWKKRNIYTLRHSAGMKYL